MRYIDEIARDIYYESTTDPEPLGWYEDRYLYRLYAVLALAKGEAVTNKDVHDAWSAWASEDNDTHPSLIPFDELEPRVQQLDEEYTKAIHKVAAQRMAGIQ